MDRDRGWVAACRGPEPCTLTARSFEERINLTVPRGQQPLPVFQSADLITRPALILLQATDRFRYRSMKNEILLENYYLPGQLETAIGRFVEYYNHQRYHESLNNLAPADVYYGRDTNILLISHSSVLTVLVCSDIEMIEAVLNGARDFMFRAYSVAQTLSPSRSRFLPTRPIASHSLAECMPSRSDRVPPHRSSTRRLVNRNVDESVH